MTGRLSFKSCIRGDVLWRDAHGEEELQQQRTPRYEEKKNRYAAHKAVEQGLKTHHAFSAFRAVSGHRPIWEQPACKQQVDDCNDDKWDHGGDMAHHREKYAAHHGSQEVEKGAQFPGRICDKVRHAAEKDEGYGTEVIDQQALVYAPVTQQVEVLNEDDRQGKQKREEA